MDRQFVWALLQLCIFLPLVLVGAYLATRFVGGRRYGWRREGTYLEVVERLAVGPRAGLYVIRLGRRYCLFSLTEGRLELVRELDDFPPEGPKLTGPGVPQGTRWLSLWRRGSKGDGGSTAT